MLNVGCWMKNPRAIQHSTLNIQHSTFPVLSSLLRRSRFLNFPHLVLQEPAAHPANGQAIDQPAERAIHGAVLRDSELAGAMVRRDLLYLFSLQGDKCGGGGGHGGVRLSLRPGLARCHSETAA